MASNTHWQQFGIQPETWENVPEQGGDQASSPIDTQAARRL